MSDLWSRVADRYSGGGRHPGWHSPTAFALACGRDQWQMAPHFAAIEAAVLSAITDGATLVVEVPVRHGKSEMVSRWLPAWYLGRNPDKRVIEVTHSAEFAAKWGRAARDLLVEHGAAVFGVEVSPRSQAANRWDIAGHAGGLLALGVGGSPIGQGADLCVVDDPYGSFADAMSPLVRRKVQEWWAGTMTSRIEPGGAVIILCSRWHEDDLPGWLQREGENVRVLRLPAVADTTDDALGRAVGEALWPERWPLEELEKKHRQTAMVHGEAVWLAQYQQTPKKPEGGMFPGDRWSFLPGLPVEVEYQALWVRGWDLAATEDGGDWTVGALIGMLPDGFSAPLAVEGQRPRFVVADVVRGQWSADRVRAEMMAAAQRDPAGTRVALPQDPGQAGKDQVQQLKRLLAGHDVTSRPVPKQTKELRAAGLSAMQREGLVALVEGAWNGALVAELEGFPRGSHDDQVDALAEAYNVAVSRGAAGPTTPQRYRDNRRRGRR